MEIEANRTPLIILHQMDSRASVEAKRLISRDAPPSSIVEVDTESDFTGRLPVYAALSRGRPTAVVVDMMARRKDHARASETLPDGFVYAGVRMLAEVASTPGTSHWVKVVRTVLDPEIIDHIQQAGHVLPEGVHILPKGDPDQQVGKVIAKLLKG